MHMLRKSRTKAHTTLTFLRRTLAGVRFLPPNYVYFERFSEQSVIVDVGCGHVAELSMQLIKAHNLRAFGVDPTRKHAPALQRLQEITHGNFQYLPVAVKRQTGKVTFHESAQNESGSILAEHTNMVHDEIRSYEVEGVSLTELVRRVGVRPIDLVKLDLEGAEYELLEAATASDLDGFKQIFVEFHHHCTHYSAHDTERIVEHIRGLKYKAFTADQHNYLFYR